MLGALALSLVIAQAEAAPPEPRPIPAPSPVPAPAPPPQAKVEPEREVAPSAVALHGRVAYRAGAAGRALGPRIGYSLGAEVQHRYATMGNRIELGVGGDLFHDRFARDVQGSSMVSPGVEVPYESLRLISQTSFAALQTLGLRGQRVRGWVGGGGGVTIGHFSTAERDLRPGNANAIQPLLRAAFEVAIVIGRHADIVFRADYTWVLTSHRLATTEGGSIPVFGDLANAGVGLGYRF